MTPNVLCVIWTYGHAQDSLLFSDMSENKRLSLACTYAPKFADLNVECIKF